jgi:hypothetical protein
MSTQVTTAFVQQYAANVTLLAQQKGSKLRDAVRVENVTGKQVFFDQIGAGAPRAIPIRRAWIRRMLAGAVRWKTSIGRISSIRKTRSGC